MGQRSPLVTLAATVAGLVVLLVVNSTQTSTQTSVQTGTQTGTQTSSPAATETTAPPTSATALPTSPPATSAPATTKPPAARPVVYAGRTPTREAVALAVKGNRAVSYVCDGRTLEAWLTGTVANGQAALRSRTGDHLTAILSATTATGTLTLNGRTLRFTIPAAGPPAGLYRARNSTSTIGWIVLPDGQQVGVDDDGTPAPAPPLDPDNRTATVNGIAVTAQTITGDEAF
ncbi:hypothetical protein [Kribbella sp. NPDC003557]|uniref:hypothetical protein n=1 Tax=Kribbella sp. NPDC003557 TaxID=3154449 RepID=UPI0033AF16C0